MGSQVGSLGRKSRGSARSRGKQRRSEGDSRKSRSSAGSDKESDEDYERQKERSLERRAEKYFSDRKLRDFGEYEHTKQTRRDRLVAKIRQNLRRKAEAQIAARTEVGHSAKQPSDSVG